MKLPQFVITFALICKKILVIEFCCSYYTTSVIYGEGMSHTESRDSLIMWSRDMQKKALSSPLLGQWPPIFGRYDLSWVDCNHRVTWLIYHVIMLYLQKGVSPVLQCPWQFKLIGSWVRVNGTHLLFQVTCQSSYHVHFEKHHVSTNARP